MANTVLVGDPAVVREAICTNAAITPGHLITRTATGVRPHNVAGGNAQSAFAIEQEVVGLGIDDAYAVGAQVTFAICAPGAQVNALVAAGAAAITAAAYLASAGDGTLAAAAAGEVAVAQALEAKDNSGGSSAVRIRVEVLPVQTIPGA